jgi:hypothetical protein
VARLEDDVPLLLRRFDNERWFARPSCAQPLGSGQASAIRPADNSWPEGTVPKSAKTMQLLPPLLGKSCEGAETAAKLWVMGTVPFTKAVS